LNSIGHWDYERGRVKTYYSHLKDEVPQNRIDLKYQFLKTEVTNSRGKTTYTLQMIQGISLVKEIKGCSSCGSLHKKLNYNRRFDLESITSVIDGKRSPPSTPMITPPSLDAGGRDHRKEGGCDFEEEGYFLHLHHRPDDPFC
jgi:hypothetical protein